MTSRAASFLDACVVAGLNIVVSGGTQDVPRLAPQSALARLQADNPLRKPRRSAS